MTWRAPGPVPEEIPELPRLVALEGRLVGAAFELMKLLPARVMLEAAQRAGRLGPRTRVIETTSGTLGLGLAIVCRRRGQPLTLVGDPVIGPEFERRLRDLGAAVVIVSGADLEQGVQQARLARVEELRRRRPDHFVPGQYDNPDNPRAYEAVARLLAARLGRIDCLVATVGSGGSSCGTARALRERWPDLRLIGIDTPGSVLFGPADGPRALRGLGSSIHPRNLDVTQFDEVHWVGADQAFLMARNLLARHGLFMGPTSGAAWLVARWWAARNPSALVVALLPDTGHRYANTVLDERWLADHGLLLREEPRKPVAVRHPAEVGPGWSRMAWDRRSLEQTIARATA